MPVARFSQNPVAHLQKVCRSSAFVQQGERVFHRRLDHLPADSKLPKQPFANKHFHDWLRLTYCSCAQHQFAYG
jgi:hypothetical protein